MRYSIFIVILMLSCALKPTTNSEQKQDKIPLPETVYDATVIVPSRSPDFLDKKIEPVIGKDSSKPDTSETKVTGWRVQIGSSMSQGEAEKLRSDAERKINEKVYIEREAPFFKIRVGNYETIDEAADMVNKIRRLGYDDAFPVKSKIIINQ